MSDMVEVVAEALRSGMAASPMVRLQANGPRGEQAMQQFFEVLAMDILEAIREPTSEMIAAEGVHTNCHMCGGHKEGWQKMIDAALSKQKSPATP